MAAGELHTILEMAEAIPGRRFFHTHATPCAGWANGIAGRGLYFLSSTALDADHHILDPVPCRAPYLSGWTDTEPDPESGTEDMPIKQFLEGQWAAQSHVDRKHELAFEARRVCWLYPKKDGSLHEFCADRAWRSADAGDIYPRRVPGIDGDWTEPAHVRMRKPK